MAQTVLDMPPDATGEQLTLLQAISQGQQENDAEIGIVLNSLNAGIGKLVQKNTKIITELQGKVLKKLNQSFVDNDNTIDSLSTSILAWTQNELDDAKALLTHLSASAGLTSPGDPLEAALVDKVASAPDIAYSASLLLALREAMPLFARLASAVERIADSINPSPALRTAKEAAKEEEEADSGGAILTQESFKGFTAPMV